MRKVELIPEAKNLMESTRSIGYSLSSAIADLIDNSIAAEADSVYVQFPNSDVPLLSLRDNGSGMTMEELLRAMRYGSFAVAATRSKSDLGRFGLGLKMASLSQCRCLTVASKKKDEKIHIARWDLDEIAKNPTHWNVLLPTSEEVPEITSQPVWNKFVEQSSGTLVVWSKLDLLMEDCLNNYGNPILLDKLSAAREHLRLVFHRYLEGDGKQDKLQIYCNDTLLEPKKPFLKASQLCSPDVFYYENEPIKMTTWLLPFPKNLTRDELVELGDFQQNQGIYIYRNRRLVIWGTWFRIVRKTELTRLLRIQVDLPNTPEMDRLWSLDVKKSSARLPETFKRKLAEQIKEAANRGRSSWTRKASQNLVGSLWKRVREDSNNNTWFVYRLNFDSPIIKEMTQKTKGLSALLHLIEKTIPVDSIYADMANDQEIKCGPDDIGSTDGFSDEEKLQILHLIETIKKQI